MKKTKKIFPLLGVILILTVAILFYESCNSKANNPLGTGDGSGSLIDLGGDKGTDLLVKWNGTDTKEVTINSDNTTYELSHPEELAWIAEQAAGAGVSTSATTADLTGKTIKFMSDINMNNQPFDGLASFTGRIDGNNKTLYGLNIDKSGVDDVGLIGILKDGGSITNLTIADSVIKGNNYVGAFVGKTEGTTVISGAVNSKTDVTGAGSHVGGIVGVANGTSIIIEASTSSGTIKGTHNVGGMIGNVNVDASLTNVGNFGSIEGSGDAVAGIIGVTAGIPTINIERAVNSGTITGQKYIAGILGYSLSNNDTIIKQSINYGKVTGNNIVSGIMGYSKNSTFENVGNAGAITSTTGSIGGIVGYISGTYTINMQYVYNYGLLESSGTPIPPNITATIGGLIGTSAQVGARSSIKNTIYYSGHGTDFHGVGNNVNLANDGSVILKATEASDMRDLLSFSGWNFGTIWEMGSDYPLLINTPK